MDVFALLFIVSFLALILALVVMYIRKHIKTKDNIAKGSKHIGWVSDVLGRGSESTELRNDGKMHNIIVGKTSYVRSYDLESSMMKREINETQEKWKETVPPHKTRVKNRSKRQRKK
jgi:rRNA processing protein Gar1